MHTNYAHHRAAVRTVWPVDSPEALSQLLAKLPGAEIEAAIIAAGGAAAQMHTRAEWTASPQGQATSDNTLLQFAEHPSQTTPGWVKRTAHDSSRGGAMRPLRPLSGVRVLDLTRVIAGPVCTKLLAAYGADVLRIDPPRFAEVASLLPETTLGKRTASLDLTAAVDRHRFERLLADADVLVVGYRGDALDRLGYDHTSIAKQYPHLITARLNAYGWDGPWSARRGFDSLVQLSCGIAAAGAAAAGTDTPKALPAQALDHATGWFLGTAIVRALTRQLTSSVVTEISASLLATAELLWQLPAPRQDTSVLVPGSVRWEHATTSWGAVRRAAFPGSISGIYPYFREPAGPLGRHQAHWTTNKQPGLTKSPLAT